jgi:hypothetical protein
MNLIDTKTLDKKIKKYEGIDAIFKNDDCPDSSRNDISNTEKEISDEVVIKNQSKDTRNNESA